MFLTMVLFVSATGALDSNLFWLYWLLKLSYVGVAFAVSIGISTLFEEFAISYLSRKSGSEISFMAPVFQANLVAFLVGSAVGAAYMLPKRLESPNFLVKIFDLLYSAIS
jgi:zinc transporter ZupT